MRLIKITNSKINSQIERFFIVAVLVIFLATVSIGLYFNKYEEQERQKVDLQKIHSLLSHIITPSLTISDLSEVRRLLFMASGEEVYYVVVDNDRTIIMPDYEKSQFSKFVLNSYKSVNDCKTLETSYRYINGEKFLVNCSILKNNDVLNSDMNIGVLLSFTKYKLFSLSTRIFYFMGMLILVFILLISLFRRLLYRRLLKPLFTLKDRISNISLNYAVSKQQIEEIKDAPSELIEIKEAFNSLLLSLQDEYNRRMETEKMKALIDLSAGVAHDIRSPLTALDVIVREIKNISEDQRIIIRNSTNRINDIANNLLTQYRQRNNDEFDYAEHIKSELVSDLLRSLISEKRLQHQNDNFDLIININENAYGKFALISSSSFNRVLSNLIDNSIEALSSQIIISLQLFQSDQNDLLSIHIQDNGCGILPETLHKISDGESISNKAKGHGLGLPHAIKTIENEWNGEFKIQSTINVGTLIEIKLPLTVTPKWFLPQLILSKNESIVIVDDDESIHQVWKKRFKDISSDINFINHFTHQDMSTWYSMNKDEKAVYLIDYEFIGHNKNGLDLIETLQISDRSYLVTSRHEDSNIRARTEMMGLKIIPKAFAVYIPIILTNVDNAMSVDLIFIDDSCEVTDAWVLHGISKGKTVATYNSLRTFKNDLSKYDQSTPIYIDSDLSDVMSGQEFAKELYEQGYKNIYLATGYLRTDFPAMYWIKNVVGKLPPF